MSVLKVLSSEGVLNFFEVTFFDRVIRFGVVEGPIDEAGLLRY